MAQPFTGPAVSLLIISITLLSFSWITVALRLWVRRRIKGVGPDDWLMVAGLGFFTIACVATILSVFNGVGTPDRYLTVSDSREGKKWFMFFQLFYVLSTVPIKSAICVALIRITPRRIYHWILYGTMFFATVSCLVTDITILSWCKPISATWDPSTGSCADQSVIVNVSYFISVISILTDWLCAILPAFILWDIQLRFRVKVSVAVVLGLGFIASTATIVRIGYLRYYTITEDYLYNIANIALWSIVESGIGIVAGSLATLRPLLKYIPFMQNTSNSDASKSNKTKQRGQSYKLDSLGRSGNGVLQATCRGGRNESDDMSESASQKGILEDSKIRVTKHVTQEYTQDV
ncbi:hypothetical protein SUNI508_13744 [Seiridium unicorne]|uniref:Rhodopsin domain-containing protein n=1 Tax=Seiridium unicorne TaxID=138068 RepID=A0ABR2VBT5_9PEZI